MRFSITALLALASAVVAQGPTGGFNAITNPKEGEEVPAGSTYEIVWLHNKAWPGDVTIALLGGSSPQTLTVVDTIAEGVDGATGTYSWDVPSSLGDLDTYGIMITLESDPSIFQYGFPFKIVNGDDSDNEDGDDDDDDDDDISTSTSVTVTSTSATSTTSDATSTVTSTTSDAEATSSTTKSQTNSTTVTSSSVTIPSSTLVSSTVHNSTSFTTSTPPPTTVTTSSVVVEESATSTTSEPTSEPTDEPNGVSKLTASSFALFGGVAMAVLAF
ncbi:hypothetical protein VTH82DRAFT_3751 [Thermothelomyces myriococcoides]